MRHALFVRLALYAVAVAAAGCNRPRATRADCERILEQIVALELRERGFNDPALLAQKQAELRHQLAPELSQCVGRPLKARAMACVENARSSEAISHRCLH